ncbi:receptor-interacting serine/threonine-protein kinase 2-like [Pristis pectinata]|uniref:receptor-interacting serine/threonine-protein kinase 2-like n=1 Tax=Pristis pectinata TaxID=685728 RepID=UPI00223DB137|nr:receptor-interacting serine/threonine-protein kinase 2-like [Pristis pectinata]
MESDCGQKRCPGAAAHGPDRSSDRPSRPSASQFTDIRPQDLQEATKVGSGGFGEVYRALHRVWRIPVAVKYMRVNGSNNHELLEEARKMHKAQFEYILRLYGITKCDLEPGIKSLGLVTEFMENGSLEDLLHCYNVPLPLRLRFVYEIALGMNFLHNLNPALYHHDLKPANILLNKDYRIKICDFGLAKWRKLTSQNRSDSSKNHGTLSYMPPECFKDINARRDTKFDVYSYGIVIWEIMTCQKPYKNAVNSQHLKLCVGNGGRPDLRDIPEDFLESCVTLINLMKKCWHENPNDRPPFSKCVHDLEPEQRSKEELRQAVQTLAQQESTRVDRHREMSNGGYVNSSSELCEPVKEQNENFFNLVEPVQESIWMECTAEVSQAASQEEAVKSPLSVVTAEECMKLAELVNVKWKALARYLGLTNGEIDTIDYDYNTDGSVEKAYQVLCKWKQQQGQKANRAWLVQSLSRIGAEHLWKG